MCWLLVIGCLATHAWLWPHSYAEIQVVYDALGMIPADVSRAWRATAADFHLDDLPALVRDGAVPFVTYPYLHVGGVHLFANVVYLLAFGRRLEQRAGSLRFGLFWLAGCVIAGAVQCWWASGSDVPVVGASGAISAALGAYLVLHRKARVLMLVPVVVFPVFVELPILILVLVWWALQLPQIQHVIALGEAQPIAYMTHAGGFAAGVLLAPLLLWPRRLGNPKPRSTHGRKSG